MRILVFTLVLLIGGCAGRREPSPEAPPPPPAPPVEAPAAKENVAVAGLMESARADTASGRLVEAAAKLERALRIEPRNARLWHQLALVRLRQGDFAQAENLAARSNTFAGSDTALRAANQRLIEQARAGR